MLCCKNKTAIIDIDGKAINDTIPPKLIPSNKWKKGITDDRFRFAIKGGYSYQIGKVSNDVPADLRIT